jgi:hypothetical protein
MFQTLRSSYVFLFKTLHHITNIIIKLCTFIKIKDLCEKNKINLLQINCNKEDKVKLIV